MNTTRIVGLALTLGLSSSAFALSNGEAEDILNGNKCLKCHGIGMAKAGPSYKEIATKHKGKPGAVDKLVKHVTTPGQVEVDGEKEDHGQLKAKDAHQAKALVEWILAR